MDKVEMVITKMTGKVPLTVTGKGDFFHMNKPSDFDKPFLNYDMMIALMRSRNIVIDDETFAKKSVKFHVLLYDY